MVDFGECLDEAKLSFPIVAIVIQEVKENSFRRKNLLHVRILA